MAGISAVWSVPIPVDGIVSTLRSVAVPGYTGIVLVEIGIRPEAAEHVQLDVRRKQTFKTDAQQSERTSIPASGVPEREKLVRDVMQALKDKLCIRTVAVAIEFHYNDGRLLKYQVVE